MPISFSATDTGRKRQMNQDFIFSSDIPVGRLPDLYIVADGMGGHRAGEYASEFTANRAVGIIEKSARSDPAELMRMALTEVNRELRVIARREPEYRGMGTTAVACVVTGRVLQVANVGDSRLYILQGGSGMRQVTHDHSLVEEMVHAGSLDEKQARMHPDRHVITRAIGAEDTLDVDLFTEVLQGDELILMCTDGLTNMLEDAQIEEIIRSTRNLEEAVKVLIAVANEAGGKDNISVTLIDPFRSA
ncbi:MAG TPA: Stp1/IreP family PP2C-type Ser/Thr phosphatase [Lachnospiraceae bacterium]|jgi:protein phosphatase|nr:Stp1/IreP family PP2C-type Ser/Thr phosphatase [Lachnospiraceae bacterium]